MNSEQPTTFREATSVARTWQVPKSRNDRSVSWKDDEDQTVTSVPLSLHADFTGDEKTALPTQPAYAVWEQHLRERLDQEAEETQILRGELRHWRFIGIVTIFLIGLLAGGLSVRFLMPPSVEGLPLPKTENVVAVPGPLASSPVGTVEKVERLPQMTASEAQSLMLVIVEKLRQKEEADACNEVAKALHRGIEDEVWRLKFSGLLERFCQAH